MKVLPPQIRFRLNQARLRELKAQAGLSNREIAEATGIPYGTVISIFALSYYEAGLKSLAALSSLFGVPINEFLVDTAKVGNTEAGTAQPYPQRKDVVKTPGRVRVNTWQRAFTCALCYGNIEPGQKYFVQAGKGGARIHVSTKECAESVK